METREILKYNNVRDFLLTNFQSKKSKFPSFTLRSWAKQLKVKSPGYLSNVLNGHRPISSTLSQKFSEYYKFDAFEQKYFSILVDFSQEKDSKKKQTYADLLRTLHPDFQFESMDLDKFTFISDWYHVAIVEMVKLADFQEDAEYLHQKLGGLVSRDKCQDALDRTQRMGLLERGEDGKLKVNRNAPLFVGSTIPSEAIRYHNKQYIDMALQKLDDEPMQERDIRGTTLAVDLEKFAELEAMISEFHRNLHKLAVECQGSHVIRINTQAFKVTK